MTPKHLLCAMLLLATAPALHAQSVRAGIEAWQRADYSGAVAIWRPLAEKGDTDAQFNLGQAYRLGRGIPTNLAAAKTWFERAAGAGHVDAQTTLGLLLFQNGDQPGGLKWLRKAADQGEPRALLVYGTALVNGDNVAQDPVLGYAFVSRAAAQGLEPAKRTLEQLDQMLPLSDRKRGVAMARNLVKGAPAPSSTTKPARKPVQVAKATPPRAAAPAQPANAPVTKATPATGNWRIQLGAFSQRNSAEALFTKLSAKPALSGRRPFYIAVGAITRLQAGPFESKAAADGACRALGVPCFAVPAK